MIIELLKGTPWFVWLIFALLLWVGIQALKPDVIPFKKMFITPTIFTIWGVVILATKLNTPLDIATWLGALGIGICIGWFLLGPHEVTADKVKGLIKTHGGPSTLILVMAIFCTKYFFGAVYAINPAARTTFAIIMADLLSSGIITGILVGKALCYAHKYKNAKHTDLVIN